MILRCTKKQKEEILDWAKNNIQCTKCLFSEKCLKASCTKELQTFITFEVCEDIKEPKSQLREIISSYLYLREKYQEDRRAHTYSYLRKLLMEKLNLLDTHLTGKHIDEYADIAQKVGYYVKKDQLWKLCMDYEHRRGEHKNYGAIQQNKSG